MIMALDPVTKRPGSCLPVSRAATVIYCVLKRRGRPGGSVLVPANLCWAAILPIRYAGMNPRFCDVDPDTGNVTVETVRQALRDPLPEAMILPHMYGNPVRDLKAIAALCGEKGVLLIEDCASAMGAEDEDGLVGCSGDYVVYSTGHSKTVDIGFGGLLVSHRNDLAAEADIEAGLPPLTEEAEREEMFFSRMYRLIRNQGEGTKLAKAVYTGMGEALRPSLLNRISEERKRLIVDALTDLPEIIRRRREAVQTYEAGLVFSSGIRRYLYGEGAVPWRFNLLVEDESLRKRLIQRCLSENLPVSDWYPVSARMFGEDACYPGAEAHEKRIVNFPLLIPEAEIQEICRIVNET